MPIRKEEKDSTIYMFSFHARAHVLHSNDILIISIRPFLIFRYKEEYQRFLHVNKDAKEMVNKYKNVMDYLTDHTGKLINTTDAVVHLYNLLKEEVNEYSDNNKSKVFDFSLSKFSLHNHFQAAQNLTLPKWTQNVFPSPMTEIAKLDFKLRSYTKTLKRINGGWYFYSL